ncbi:heterodimeric methylmalonyl-CoA mutase small subunit [Bradyrhizobium sp. Rc2d]|uniref:methylmalonyl-CoA mutase subunit beta n=1 Tax=Bradyrhizobium sp. Rc2d TaxID=1855321 RepID=UPI0008827019|nr:methylmalonyl-CoA mutase subunit beta [Bradyrhizobium sp. Rc2d]SDI26107.1 heterodimeric methylmalonyl-CoA mutase small subunit [Bradyrhizobium sp. Rc2d]
MNTERFALASGFAPASREDWRTLVDGVLKGAPFEKLIGKTYDGLRIEPIYLRAKDTTPVEGRAPAAPWQIMQRIDHPDAVTANRQALEDLEYGATGLALVFAGANCSRGFGLDQTPDAVAKALEDVHLDAGIGIELQIGTHGRKAAIHVAEHVKSLGLDPAVCDIRFGLDPLGTCALRGCSPYTWDEIARTVSSSIKGLVTLGFRGPFAVSDGRIVHDAGGSEVQELTFVLACGVAYLHALEAARIPLDEARSMIYARLSADADQFLTMAKFRALRLLWARIETACGLAPKPLFIAADSSWRMLTRRDPSVNMLRATIATFSAGIAGANAITVLPHTLALGLPDAFARRVARNTQLVLLEESNLAKVSDPAAGAGSIEALTTELCEAAWRSFQEIENAGGIFAALQQGTFQAKITATRRAREANLAKRRDPLTGVSEFANLGEGAAAVLNVTPMALPPNVDQKYVFDALPPIRLAEPFESLRDKSDAILKLCGMRPRVFLASLGTPTDFTARATFAKSFFEAGGIEAVDGAGVADPAELAFAFTGSGAELACLCSSDKIYAERAEISAQALQQVGARHIYLAGLPSQSEAAFRRAGIGSFIHVSCDALATLNAAYDWIQNPKISFG